MSQRTLLLLSQDNNHYERLLKAARLPHLHILRADNQSDAEKMIDGYEAIYAHMIRRMRAQAVPAPHDEPYPGQPVSASLAAMIHG